MNKLRASLISIQREEVKLPERMGENYGLSD